MKYIKWFIAIGIIGIIAYSYINRPTFSSVAFNNREAYISNLLNMDNPPLKDDAGIQFFPASETMVIEAKLEKLEKPQTYQMAMTDTTKEAAKLAGTLKFTLAGKAYAFLVFEEGETLMLPFKDASNGSTTYGGGRYVNIPAKDLDPAHVHIDFNEAHNFYCAYNSSYICPVPPTQNTITTAINAGEKTFKP